MSRAIKYTPKFGNFVGTNEGVYILLTQLENDVLFLFHDFNF